MPSNNGSSRKLIQLVLRDSGYVLWLRSLLLEDGRHRILLADRPDLTLAGVVVIDEDNFESLAPVLNPERFVVIVPKGPNNISRLWDSGIRHVVFEEDSLRSAQLAIVAVEMKLATLRRREGHRVSSTKESQFDTGHPTAGSVMATYTLLKPVVAFSNATRTTMTLPVGSIVRIP